MSPARSGVLLAVDVHLSSTLNQGHDKVVLPVNVRFLTVKDLNQVEIVIFATCEQLCADVLSGLESG